MNPFSLVELQAKVAPTATAVAYPGGVATYRTLATIVGHAATHLERAGIARGGLAAVHVGNPFLHLAIVLALAKRGIASVSIRQLADLAEAGLTVGAILTERYPDRSYEKLLLVDQGWLAPPGTGPAETATADVAPDYLAVVVLSSGTTGRPKCVGLSYGLLAERVLRMGTAWSPGQARVLPLMGFSSYGGLIVALRTLWLGGLLSFASGPEEALELIELFQLDTVLATPAQLKSLLEAADRHRGSYSSLKAIHAGGSRTSQELLRQIRTRLCRRVRLTYAATEFCVASHGYVSELDPCDGVAGYLRPWVRMEAVDPDGRVLPAGETGLLRLRSPVAVSGYLKPSSEDAEIFRDGWLYPGDLGSIREDGLVVIAGRAAETITRGGPKISPEVLEEKLASVAGLKEAAFVSAPRPDGIDEVWLAVVPDGSVSEARLEPGCLAACGDWRPERLVFVAELPRNAMGKIRRDALRERIAALTG